MQQKSTKLKNSQSQKGKRLTDFVSYNGEYSSGRLIFLIGSIVVIIQYIRFPESVNTANLMMSVIGFAAGATTVSKFAERPNRYNNYEQYERPDYVEEDSYDASETQERGRTNLR